MIAPQLNAPFHQHFFNFRLDTHLDGMNNSVVEVNTVPEKRGPHNPFNNAFHIETTTFKTEQEAQRIMDMASQRTWKNCESEFSECCWTTCRIQKLCRGKNCLPFCL
ncbi:hypothetical protein GCM10020331_087550 [Ectobacillus funiculus]